MARENFITLSGDDGDIEVEVLEELEYNGEKYLLVADAMDIEDDQDCYILRDTSDGIGDDASYELASDDEADELFELFSKKLDGEDVDLTK